MSHPTQIANVKASAATQPWSCTHEPGKSQIAAYNCKTGKYETIIETFPASGQSAETIAKFITKIINTSDANEQLIDEMRAALELCLECEIDWETEQKAYAAWKRAKRKSAASRHSTIKDNQTRQ